MDIFKDHLDYKFFLYRLKESLSPDKIALPGGSSSSKGKIYIRKRLPPNSFCLLSYCLMPNRFHFLIKQTGDLPISKIISKVCTGYSMYFNKKYKRVGGLFQDQFKAVRVENDSQLLWTSAYIHQNPAVAGLVEELADYPWSSYPDYAGLREGTLCGQSFILGMFKNDRNAYKNFVLESYDKIKERKDLEHLFLD